MTTSMEQDFGTEGKIIDINWKSPTESPNEQSVTIDLENIGEIICFDGIAFNESSLKVSVKEEDIGETRGLELSLLAHKAPEETSDEPGFRKNEDSNEWDYSVTGEIIKIGEQEGGEKMIVLNVKGHNIQMQTSESIELKKGEIVNFPSNRVDIKALKR